NTWVVYFSNVQRFYSPSSGESLCDRVGNPDSMEVEEAEFNWEEFMEETGANAAPHTTFKHVEVSLQSSFQPGMKLEVANKSGPDSYWVATIITTCGQLLLLRYSGYGEDRKADFWCDVMTAELHPVGWCTRNGKTLMPPEGFRSLKTPPDWQQALEEAQVHGEKNPLPLEVFKDHVDVSEHAFQAGMKLEMVSAWAELQICPVSVTKVYSRFFFQVTLDDLSAGAAPRSVVCHAGSPGILPVQWSLKNGVGLERPRGYGGHDFDWADYLKQGGSLAAPDACFPDTWQNRDFAKDMWLEAVNPHRPAEVCVAQITQVRGRLLWLRLEGTDVCSECIVDVESTDIFPVGWCEANAYPLTPPLKPVCQKQKKIAVVQPEKQLAPFQPAETTPVTLCSANGRYCCSKIYVNHRCFSGPYLNKGRIAELPQAVGPGKCTLVLKELLSMLINAAYKPGRVLKELQEVEDQSWDCQEETLKAKYKGKTYRSTIRIVRLAEQIPDFCRKVCVKLQCCMNLFGPALVADKCPENCAVQTKTKYTYYYGKKRKLSKPAGGEEEAAAEGEPAKPARRRKKRKAIFVLKKRRSSTVDYAPAGSPQDSEEDEDIQSGSEGTSSEPREDHTDASSVEATSSRPRRAAALRRSLGAAGGRDAGEVEEEEGQLVLDSNPLEWSVDEVVQFINSTDCAALANIFQEQDMDGQAMLLLTLPTVQECMDLKLGPAIKLCHQIERVKVAFYKQYAN
uniref:Scm like with four mbt domains 2 n=1 Tax=Gasterosteus aculeatus aculeatus TaxID=481459 RepID=A0AAQ4R3K6_GASAC